MIKKLFALCLAFSSFSCFAFTLGCGTALPPDNPGFCPSFKTVAQCRCRELGYPNSVCGDINKMYNLMIFKYWSLKRACENQHDTTFQECMDAWNCYRSGGRASNGNLCSATGSACQ